MNKEKNKKSNQPVSNYLETEPKEKVDLGNKAVVKAEDEVYHSNPAVPKTKNPAKVKEESEQPVHVIKDAPTDG